jgi:hypothetical protein
MRTGSRVRTGCVKSLAGELYDPMDAWLAAGGEHARGPRQALDPPREAEPEQPWRMVSALF